MGTNKAFKEDKDLAFLQFIDWEDLKILADCLIKDYTGTEQWTGSLKSTIENNIKNHHSREECRDASWRAIASEIQLFGGNTIVNFFRRSGVSYREIAVDVAEKVKADYHSSDSIEQIERSITRVIYGRDVNLDDLDFINHSLNEKGLLGLTSIKDSPVETIKSNLAATGTGAGTGLFGAIAKAKRLTPSAIPIAIALGAATSLLTIPNPAYRVTILAVTVVSILRRNYLSNPSSSNFL